MTVVQLQRGKSGSRGTAGDKSPLIAAIDIGSTKVACMIAQVVSVKNRAFGGERKRQLKVLGFAHQASRGVRAGTVVDLVEAERSIRLVVDATERQAGKAVDSVYVNVSGGRPICSTYKAQTKTSGGQVSAKDVGRLIELAHRKIDPGKRIILHTNPTGYGLDHIGNLRDPRGMFGERVGIQLNAVSVEPGPIKNLAMVIKRCHLDIAGLVIAPYAAGRSVLVEDEVNMGVACIDLGGETSTISVFSGGNIIFADAVPVGGHHITMDIA
ncbi:MAG: cell division protein FtsA, partial [Hyphomicrobiales bacterium]